jgi:hypothetical protein
MSRADNLLEALASGACQDVLDIDSASEPFDSIGLGRVGVCVYFGMFRGNIAVDELPRISMG